jgi:TldD protein
VLERALIGEVLDRALSRGADFAELYAEDGRDFRLVYVDRVPRRMVRGHDRGAGLRLFYGQREVYVHAADLSREKLLELADVAVAAGPGGVPPNAARPLSDGAAAPSPAVEFPAASADLGEYLDFARRADESARATDPAVVQAMITVSWTEKEILVAASDGTYSRELRSYLMAHIEAMAAEGGARETGDLNLPSRTGLDGFRKHDPAAAAREAAEIACRMVRAAHAPAGRMPAVIGSAFGGVIFHEACGHGLETTAVAKNASVFGGRLGQAVAAECVTAVDDGTLAGMWGSTAVDDEGLPTRRTVLIDKGVLRSYLVDRLGSLKTGLTPTGSGRRQSYRYAPTSRMRNTFIAPGKASFEETLSGVKRGLYAKKMGGGSVNPATGEFNFAVREGYLIKDGKLAGPVRGASLIGFGPEVIRRVDRVGPDLELEPGTCGSISGNVPTTVGQPTIRVAEITVGGRVGP